MKKYKIRFLKNGGHLDFAVQCEEPYNATNKNCFILAIGSETDEVHFTRINRDLRKYSEPMSVVEIVYFIENNPQKFDTKISYCKGVILEEYGQKIEFKEKIEIKRNNKNNGTKDPPN